MVYTRGKSNFYLPRIRRNYGKQHLLYQEIAEWNCLDKSIRDMRSLLIFKQALKTAIFKLVFYPLMLLNI